jgi:hypothetical protein
MRWAVHEVRVEKRGGAYRILVGSLEGRDYLEDPGLFRRIEIKMDPRDLGWGHELDWSGQERNRSRALVNAVMNLRVP